jgi:hypothetical protein
MVYGTYFNREFDDILDLACVDFSRDVHAGYSRCSSQRYKSMKASPLNALKKTSVYLETRTGHLSLDLL